MKSDILFWLLQLALAFAFGAVVAWIFAWGRASQRYQRLLNSFTDKSLRYAAFNRSAYNRLWDKVFKLQDKPDGVTRGEILQLVSDEQDCRIADLKIELEAECEFR